MLPRGNAQTRPLPSRLFRFPMATVCVYVCDSFLQNSTPFLSFASRFLPKTRTQLLEERLVDKEREAAHLSNKLDKTISDYREERTKYDSTIIRA